MTELLAPTTLWPPYGGPGDLEEIERVPLAERQLPHSTYDALRTTAIRQPDAPALVVLPDGARWDAPVEVSYGALLRKVTSSANAFAAFGASRQAPVGLLSPNVLELVPAILGAEAAAVAVPVNPSLSQETIAALLGRAGVRVLVAAGPEVDERVWQLARRVAAELGLTALLALHPTAGKGQPTELEPMSGTRVAYLAEVQSEQQEEVLRVGEPSGEELAAFFHTGGTTGSPKLAAHTHAMQVVDGWGIAAIDELGQNGTMLAALPLFHVNALIVTVLAPVLRGMRVLWAGPLGYRDPRLLGSFWKVVERYGVTAMSAVPTVYDTLSRLPVDADISSLALPVVGAAPLPLAVRQAWAEHTGVPLCEGYGLTEATCATARSFPAHQRSGSAGQRLPYQRVATVSVDKDSAAWTFLSPGSTGTLVVSGPTVFPGYVVRNDADGVVLEAGEKLRDGWLDTGDVGSVSADGFVTVSGRAKDLIIRGGHNIDPAAIEAVLRQHPAVLDAGVVGRPDRHAGEVPVAFVALREPVTAQDLQSWASERASEPAAVPRTVTVLPALPHTSVGKPYKPALRALATAQELTERLAELGYAIPDGSDWCTDRDGTVAVDLPSPDDEQLRTAVADLLSHYSISWRLT